VTPVCVGEHRSPPALSMVCRDGAQGFGLGCGGRNGWHTLTLALHGPKEQRTGTLTDCFGVPSQPAGVNELFLLQAMWQ